MTKQAAVDEIAAAIGCTKADASKALDALFAVVTRQLQEAGGFRLMGFGTFTTRQVAEHKGRNPRTGETITLPASVRVAFKAGTELRAAVKPKPRATTRRSRAA